LHAFLRYLTIFHCLFNSQQWLQESGHKWWLVQCPVDHLRWDLWRSRLCPFVLLQISSWTHSVPSKPKNRRLKRNTSGHTRHSTHTYTHYMHHVFEDGKIWFVFCFGTSVFVQRPLLRLVYLDGQFTCRFFSYRPIERETNNNLRPSIFNAVLGRSQK
jgi:hypothetical protein